MPICAQIPSPISSRKQHPFFEAIAKGNWALFREGLRQVEEKEVQWSSVTEYRVFEAMVKNRQLPLSFFTKLFEVCPQLLPTHGQTCLEKAIIHHQSHLTSALIKRGYRFKEAMNYLEGFGSHPKVHHWGALLIPLIKQQLDLQFANDDTGEKKKKETFLCVSIMWEVSMRQGNMPLAKLLLQSFPEQNWGSHFESKVLRHFSNGQTYIFWMKEAQKQNPNFISQWHEKNEDLLHRWIRFDAGRKNKNTIRSFLQQPLIQSHLGWENKAGQNALVVALKSNQFLLAKELIHWGLSLPQRKSSQDMEAYYQSIFNDQYLAQKKVWEIKKVPLPKHHLDPHEWVALSEKGTLDQSTPQVQIHLPARRF